MARIAASGDIPVWQASNVDLGIFDAFRLHASAAAPNCTFGSDLCGNFVHEHSLLKEPLYAIVPPGFGRGIGRTPSPATSPRSSGPLGRERLCAKDLGYQTLY